MTEKPLMEKKLKWFFDMPLSRKGFLKITGTLLGWAFIGGGMPKRAFARAEKTLGPRPGRKASTLVDLAVIKGPDPAINTRKAVETLGGIQRFVRKGDVVVIKPNIGWDRTPEQAANTNPAVVAELVRMCREAGAKMVKVFDNTCNDARRCYENSGIAAAARSAGGIVFYTDDWRYLPGRFPAGSLMQDWPIFKDAVECDCFINVPIAKNHGLTGLTLSMKNLMGVCGGSRGKMHQQIDRKLTEVTAFIKPDLTVIDATRILMRHGPTGGNLSDVEERRTIIASADPVLADARAAMLFGIAPEDVGYVVAGAAAGLGSKDLKKARIKELTI